MSKRIEIDFSSVNRTRNYIKDVFKKPKKSGLKEIEPVDHIILEPDMLKHEVARRTECTSVTFKNGDYCLYFHNPDSLYDAAVKGDNK